LHSQQGVFSQSRGTKTGHCKLKYIILTIRNETGCKEFK